jgi:hypothetical protein
MIDPQRSTDQTDDLEEILDLAAELSPPDQLAAAWDRRARFSGDRFSHMMRYVDKDGAEEAAPPVELPAVDEREAAREQRNRMRAVITELGDLSGSGVAETETPVRALINFSTAGRQAGWRWVDASEAAATRARWRKPAGISGGILAACLVLGVAWHTLGPNVSTVNYTTGPSTGGSAANVPQQGYQPLTIYSPPPTVSVPTPAARNPLAVVPVVSPPATHGSASSAPVSIVGAPIQLVPSPTTPPILLSPPPTGDPTPAPTAAPTPAPTPAPTATPAPTPTPAPTATPAPTPTPAPTATPTPAPTATPTPAPTATPTPAPTAAATP